MAAKAYRYTGFEYADEIRLLAFAEEQRFHDEPRIRIFHARLSSNPTYRALSYAWGDGRVRVPVSCNDGDTVKVTVNCKSALMALRRDDFVTPLWIDAVCIDQQNIRERSHQVRIMPYIYRGAKKVQAYLGEESNNSSIAMKFLARSFTDLILDSNDIDAVNTPIKSFPAALADAIDKLLQREWFNRQWVLQEIHMAKYAEMLCGTLKIPWKALKMVLLHYDKTNVPPILTLDEGGLVSMSLLECLVTTRSCKCRDPRDKLYAVLGLTHDTTHFEANFDIFLCCSEIEKVLELWAHQDIIDFERVYSFDAGQLRRFVPCQPLVNCISTHSIKRIEPDYSKSYREVYTALAKQLIDLDKGLHILAGAEGYQTSQELPSWVPCWDVPSPIVPLSFLGKTRYRASGDLPAEVSFSTDSKILRTRGEILGSVDRLCPFLDLSEYHYRILPRWTHRADIKDSIYDKSLWIEPLSIEPLAPWHVPPWESVDYYWHSEYIGGADQAVIMNEIQSLETPLETVRRGRQILGMQNYVGFGPDRAEFGDLICVLYGGRVPFVIRPQENQYILIGECFIHGAMNGEALNGREKDFHYISLR